MKKKIYFVTVLIFLIAFLSGITYSFFNSGSSLSSSNQNIASFVFEANNLEHIDLNLKGLVPGEEREYLFSVTNTKEKKVSDVTVEYQLSIKTYHFMPLIINLYEIKGDEEILYGTCDESSARNHSNELVCDMKIKTLSFNKKQEDNYKIKIVFPKEYDDISYSNLVDYLNIEIKSWQKV